MPKSLALGVEVNILALRKKLVSASMERREGEKDVLQGRLFPCSARSCTIVS
jgi:hypothetical protein